MNIMFLLETVQAFVVNTYNVFLNPATSIVMILLYAACIKLLKAEQTHGAALHLLAALGALLLLATWLALGQHVALFTVGFFVPWDAMPTPTVPMWQMRLHSFFSQAPFVVYLIPAFLVAATSAWMLSQKVRRASSYANIVEQFFIFGATNLLFIGATYILYLVLYSFYTFTELGPGAEESTTYTDMLLPLVLLLLLLAALFWSQRRLGNVSREINA